MRTTNRVSDTHSKSGVRSRCSQCAALLGVGNGCRFFMVVIGNWLYLRNFVAGHSFDSRGI
ncbi:uncharacterized protein K441DRAFT_233521 [Cenococcum geophilum 1.58]|uniref:uncharacterized protein n=1 Tax=Cenococcum geophilum 1.58 TaxID=794803 RepID=UPI00358E0519|nr:hypothetical protein K441DRAFT_233521 [Cenococcum geophilum 1.58]